jgi:ElaB/YqjD/DUF883 family membrane-anchored ribosome-binding protein
MKTEPLPTEPGSNGRSATSRATSAGFVAAPSGVAREFQDFVADVQDMIQASTSLTGEDLARAKANLNARVAAARAFVEEMPAAISDRVRKTAQVTDDYVREQPWQSMGVAAAVGLLVGFLLGRRGQ